jgi:polyisoprenoid-binding protein YceI
MTTVSPAIAPATYRIDPARSTVRFSVAGMFGLHTARGTFTIRDGTVLITEDPSQSRAAAVLDAGSFHTGNRRRDADVCGKNFLDVARHPEIRFTSREVSGTAVTGVLTVCGTGQRVTLDLTPSATEDGCRFTATTRIDRYAFGVTGSKGFVGRYVDVDLDIVASRT